MIDVYMRRFSVQVEDALGELQREVDKGAGAINPDNC